MVRKQAFTLVELLVVIAILCILLALLLPSFSKARDMARLAVCQGNENGIFSGLAAYAAQNNGWLPSLGIFTPNDPNLDYNYNSLFATAPASATDKLKVLWGHIDANGNPSAMGASKNWYEPYGHYGSWCDILCPEGNPNYAPNIASLGWATYVAQKAFYCPSDNISGVYGYGMNDSCSGSGPPTPGVQNAFIYQYACMEFHNGVGAPSCRGWAMRLSAVLQPDKMFLVGDSQGPGGLYRVPDCNPLGAGNGYFPVTGTLGSMIPRHGGGTGRTTGYTLSPNGTIVVDGYSGTNVTGPSHDCLCRANMMYMDGHVASSSWTDVPDRGKSAPGWASYGTYLPWFNANGGWEHGVWYRPW
jgi:prepilin-type N-terminal cleavage/methylation domain-containing protein/prepilin-type processing-associated H-X9-DG protein